MAQISRKEITADRSLPYHILSRAIDGRPIFQHEDECYRFIFQMYAANYGTPARNLQRKDVTKIGKALLNGEEISRTFIIDKHEPLVHFLSFVQTVNHYHLCLVPNVEDGIPRFMHKLNMAFAKYFNLKHSRKAALFEKPYKIVPITTDIQLTTLIQYINIKNVLDVYQPRWRKKGLKNKREAWKFLHEYPLSSFPDITGKRNSHILAPQGIREKFFADGFRYTRTSYSQFAEAFLTTYPSFSENIYLE